MKEKQQESMLIKPILETGKDMANGMRNTSKTPLSDSEIEYIKAEIQRIGADTSVFVCNDEEHIATSTCYNFVEDKSM